LLFTVSACSKAKKNNGVLEVAIQSSPVTLDPRLATDAEGDKICQLIFDGLMARNKNLEVVPGLALRYELLSDTSYKFHLRGGVVFHDGTPFTAKDVVYTYESILQGKMASPFREAFRRIKQIKALDDLTVQIDLKEPYAPFLTLLTRGIVPKDYAAKMGDKFGAAPIGTGPYKLMRFVPETIVELGANHEYFGRIPRTKLLRLQIIKDDNIRVLKLLKGDIDLVQNGIPPLLLPKVTQSKKLDMITEEGIVMAYLGVNLKDKALSDPRIRKAIAHAINRDEIISHRFGGMASPANSILSPLNWAYSKDLKQYKYDPEKAKALLKEAGSENINLSHKTSVIKERIDIARMIAHHLGQVGINVKVEPYEWGTFYRDVKRGNFQIYTLSWVGVTEPDFFYDVAHSSQMPPKGFNRDRYKNEEIDKLVEEGRTTMDQEKRKKIYAKVQEILLEDLPYIPLWYEKNIVVYQKYLDGVSLRPDASYLTFINITKS
jgi:peptide/nickel transport system substrate-binding protein